MTTRYYILATAGHVDHGKSSLVEALCGTHPDRLPEERARGITIDLGFAFLDLTAPGGQPLRLGIIDVPGHEDFVRNAVAGMGAVDIALLTVAADDRWMPQTEEHLQLLLYAGVRQAVVAVTKADLVADVSPVVASVRQRLRGTVLADAPIVPVSARNGSGLAELRHALATQLAATPPRPDIGKPRLAVDRAFSLPGIGTIVTGTLIGGTIAPHATLAIQPGDRPARVRSVQSFGRDAAAAQPGTRTALHLPDLHVAKRPGVAGGVARQETITLPNLAPPAAHLHVLLSRLQREEQPPARADQLRHGAGVTVHHGTMRTAARVLLPPGTALEAGQQSVAQLRCQQPLFVFIGDRLVLRDAAGRRTLAGAVVLEDAAPGAVLTAAEALRLEALAAAISSPRELLAALLEQRQVVLVEEAFAKTNFSAEAADAARTALLVAGKAVAAGALLVEPRAWHEALETMVAAVGSFHRQWSEQAGMKVSDLRQAVAGLPAGRQAFDALLAAACAGVLRGVNGLVCSAGHRPALPPRLRAAGDKIRMALAEKPFEPPAKKHLTADTAGISTLRYLVQTGEAVEVGPDLVMAATAVNAARQKIVQHIAAHGPATLSQLREALGTTRRVMVPLAEYFDRAGVTLRQGELRALRGQ